MKEAAVEGLVVQLKSEIDDINSLIAKLHNTYGVDVILHYDHNNGLSSAPKLNVIRITQTVDYTK
jgi:fructose/tagatose bisphosphate aldolase